MCKIDNCDRKPSKRGMCEKHYRQWWRAQNKEHVKQTYLANEVNKYSSICPQCNNTFTHRVKQKKYCNLTCRNSARHKRKRYSNIGFKIKHNIRTRLRKAIKGKDASFSEYIGCTIDQLILHLESQFDSKMAWENYGEWHIDHIVPLASFDLTDRAQLLKACNFNNLQPLWKDEHLIKTMNENKD